MKYKYIHWPTICRVAKENPFLAIGLVTLDLSSDIGIILSEELGHFFLTDSSSQEGPVPWSWIINHPANGTDYSDGVDCVTGCEKFDIPNFRFAYPGDEIPKDSGVIPLPLDIDYQNLEQGDIFKWNGTDCVVLLSDAGCALDFTLAKCVDLQC